MEADALAEEREERWWCGELHRLRAVFLAAMGADETQIEALFQESHQNRKGAEVGFASKTRRGNLHGIPSPKSECVRRTWIPTASLMNACSGLSLGLVGGSPALSNKRSRCKARTLRLQDIR